MLYFYLVNSLISIGLSLLFFIMGFTLILWEFTRIRAFRRHFGFPPGGFGGGFEFFPFRHYGDLEEQHQRDHREEKVEHGNLPFGQHSITRRFKRMVLFFRDFFLANLISGSVSRPVLFYT